MGKYLKAFAFCVLALAVSATAQTTVTNNNDGTAGSVPVYTGSASLTNSPININGSNVGIGTTAPAETLHVNGVQGTPAAGGNNTGLAWFSENNGNNGLNLGYYYVPGQTPYGWVQSEYRGSPGVYYPMSLNPLGGNVGIGTTSPSQPLEVNGNIKVDGTPGTNGVIFPDGTTQTTAFIPANCGADYAESVGVTGSQTTYEPGDILVIDPDHPGQFLKANQAYSTMVAGVYSTKPGFVGRLRPASDPASAGEIPMAMVGRVPTKVSAENGSIKVGDLLVTSSKEGYAMKGTDRSQMLGAVIGKALGSLDSGTGVIQVLVTLQ